MSQRIRLIAVAGLSVVVTILVMVFATRSAAAQSGVAVCTDQTGGSAIAAQQWINEQIQSGRTRFVSIERGTCAW
jgi:hypothetical protein